ncbi:helix-turn-helix transcriptional regulator [Eubacterium multiforme]|uniref:Excisionase family DNA binding protein n=1 Tax=Eubacterium multiforme TaxID=83339 RepID=A0ABT9UXZ7_9FIRM|nr:helix-turn-helix domain-containing protein [Eubacterium multiforme]MDQ0151178.1 excisionase family DNA binding protein [Eubacterium multiforme]
MNLDIENLLTKEDVAEYLNYKPKTIERWVREGNIKCCPNVPGNELRFNKNYILGLGRMDFKLEPSPEVYRVERKYKKILKEKEEEIISLKKAITNLHIQSTQAMNTLLSIENIKVL